MLDWTWIFQSFLPRRRSVLAVLIASLAACAADDDTGDDVEDDDSITEERDSGKKDSGSARDAATDARARDAEIARDAGRVDSGSSARDSGLAARDGGRGTSGESGTPDASETSGSDPEPGRLAGITAAHNHVRAEVDTAEPLPDLTWSPELAAYAQEWTDMLAMAGCTTISHRSSADLQRKGYGENLAVTSGPTPSTAQQTVNSWAGEVACWTYGTFSVAPGVGGTDACDMTCYQAMHSDGCGHYTQIVWRKSTEVGCGVSTCQSGLGVTTIWVCNYSPPGNFVGQAPY